jgi:hypothetical protein
MICSTSQENRIGSPQNRIGGGEETTGRPRRRGGGGDDGRTTAARWRWRRRRGVAACAVERRWPVAGAELTLVGGGCGAHRWGGGGHQCAKSRAVRAELLQAVPNRICSDVVVSGGQCWWRAAAGGERGRREEELEAVGENERRGRWDAVATTRLDGSCGLWDGRRRGEVDAADTGDVGRQTRGGGSESRISFLSSSF